MKDMAFKSSFQNTPKDSYYAWSVRLQIKTPISVIIPVYNLTVELVFMIKSDDLLSSVDEVIVVDDCGPNNDVLPFFSSINYDGKKLKFIRHNRNKGFVTAVNSGLTIANPNNDVIVLNSDAIINSHSIKNLQIISKSFNNVGTVSPLSNSNGFHSIPTKLQGSVQERFSSLASINNNLISNVFQLSEITPVNNGFCLYVTRKLINILGLFDDNLFYRGYGEETDYCLRGLDSGYLNLISFSSFGIHSAGSSFSAEKKYLQKINGRILKAISPEFNSTLSFYEKNSKLNLLNKINLNQESSAIDRLIISRESESSFLINNGAVVINPFIGDSDPKEIVLYSLIRFYNCNIEIIGAEILPRDLNHLIESVVRNVR